MSITMVIIEPDVSDKNVDRLAPVISRFHRLRGSHRINLWGVEYGREARTEFILDFVPIGKVTQEKTGKRLWLKVRNNKLEAVKP